MAHIWECDFHTSNPQIKGRSQSEKGYVHPHCRPLHRSFLTPSSMQASSSVGVEMRFIHNIQGTRCQAPRIKNDKNYF